MPLQATSGAASYDAFGGGVAAIPNYIEDVFSTYLYTAAGSTQNVNNGVDLSTKGGLLWIKARTSVGVAGVNMLMNSISGFDKYLISDQTTAQQSFAAGDVITATTTGFSVPNNSSLPYTNYPTNSYASWTFRKQPKFFDVVTYTGNGTASRAISHSLGSAPAVMIVKQTDGTRSWPVYHRSVPTGTGYLNTTQEFFTGSGNGVWGDSAYNNIAPTSTVFYVGSDSEVNGNGLTYVAYLFAHDAGGFGLTGTDNVISCGSVITDGSGNASVTLGYEPQWLLFKSSSSAEDWYLVDNMRGFTVAGQPDPLLFPNTSGAENSGASLCQPTATGFDFTNSALTASATYIYIAIRRGPMKVPTSGTSVFSPNVFAAAAGTQITTGFPVDMQFQFYRDGGFSVKALDRLRGVNSTTGTVSTPWLATANTAAEASGANTLSWNNTGFQMPSAWEYNLMSFNNFRRAPSFFDEVCYTGTGVGTSQTHNLGVIPELKIIKSRSGTVDWVVGGSIISGVGGRADSIILNSTAAVVSNSTYWAAADTSTTFSVRAGNGMSDGSGSTYVAYLFATCTGVSKVGSYTGTGTTLQVDCGFTGGARFVLIKRTDSTGDWYVWDSARGIVSGNDPYLLLNSTAAEVTSTDYIDTYSAGFEISSTAPAAINASGGTYIFLAIA